jgi:hypothetical protein
MEIIEKLISMFSEKQKIFIIRILYKLHPNPFFFTFLLGTNLIPLKRKIDAYFLFCPSKKTDFSKFTENLDIKNLTKKNISY